MDEKRFIEILDERLFGLEKKIDNKMLSLEEKIDNKMLSLEEKIDNKMLSLEEKIDQKLKENNEIIIKRVDEKLMDHGAYFEHKYGEQISAIWTKLQVMDDKMDLNHEEIKNLEREFNRNDLSIMDHDIRISKLEEKISS